jgi:hypothetical protein
MNVQLKKISTAIAVLTLIIGLASCQKIITYPKADIEAGSIFIAQADTVDAVSYNVLPGKDTTLTVNFQAAIAGQPSAYDNTVTFKVDTSKMAGYRTEHGDAPVLPASAYQFVKSEVDMPPGAPQSVSAQIKLLHTDLIPIGGVYVLPIVIANVNGKSNLMRQGQVFYIVFTNVIDPKTFKIISSTSDDGYDVAQNILAGKQSSYWASTFMISSFTPQSVVVDMINPIPVSAITYYNGPDNASYGTPLQLQVELSTDGTTWIDQGTFAGTPGNNKNTLSFTRTNARYFKLTILQVAPYFGTYYISEISAVAVDN